MNKKLKLTISLLSGLGASGLIHRFAKLTKTGTGVSFIDAGILLFEATVFIGATGYTNSIINTIEYAVKKTEEENEEEVESDGSE